MDNIILPGIDKRALLKFPYAPDEWKKMHAKFDDAGLQIGQFQVMQVWEKPCMEEMAKIVSADHGDVLEVGFGLGISSDFIQQFGVRTHTIIELHPAVFKNLKTWAAGKLNVKLLEGSWETILPTLPDESFNAILFDAFPLTPDALHKNHFDFFPHAFRLLKKQGRSTYYSDEAKYLPGGHQDILLRRFARIVIKKVSVDPGSDCQYWRNNQMIIVEARKE